MSKLIDKLNETSRPPSSPIGFGKTQGASKKSRILVIASVDPEGTGDLASSTDGVLLSSDSLVEGKTLGTMSKALTDTPWGVRTHGEDIGKLEKFVKAGGDFVVFPPEKTPLALLKFEKLGKVIEFEGSIPDNLLRAANEIPADGVFLNAGSKEGDSLSWQSLLIFRRFADMLAKPLLVSVPVAISAKELVVLWEAGVTGVVIPASDSLKELMDEVNKLTFPPQRKVARREAILPHLSPGVFARPEEEEEEEEDE